MARIFRKFVFISASTICMLGHFSLLFVAECFSKSTFSKKLIQAYTKEYQTIWTQIRPDIFLQAWSSWVQVFAKDISGDDKSSHQQGKDFLFNLMLYVPVINFQSCAYNSWIEPLISRDKVSPVRPEPATPQSQVEHSTVERLGSC